MQALNPTRWLVAAVAALVLVLALGWTPPAMAITAPELRGSRSLQNLQPDMHGRQLQQQEFLKADLRGFDFSGSDLRGSVFNGSRLDEADLRDADLRDVVGFASRFDGADLRGARLDHAMLLQSRFAGAVIDDADFSEAVLDQQEQRALCARASGVHPISGVATRDSLRCRQ
jgi:uncharacterized protein YjbI with pentapeptide repeats